MGGRGIYLVGNPLRIVIPGGAGPSTCAGLGVVTRPLPGRLPIPLGNTILKLGDGLLDGGSAGAADLFKLNPGGKRLEISGVSNLTLLSTLDVLSLSVAFNLKPGGKSFVMSSLNALFGDSVVESEAGDLGTLKPGGKNLLMSSRMVATFGAVVVDLGTLKPGGRNLLMSSTIVTSDTGRLLVLSLDLKPGGRNLLTSSVTVLRRTEDLVVDCTDFLKLPGNSFARMWSASLLSVSGDGL